ncbi:Hpt domain-containing protein [Actibacterium sp. XHP0104]|uniref:Hpt domain-containing protein n=1 Tax=Actibacterium sp. XHP0104 TaxID=2984335 RepID=UPI0021E93269|nr:Hpt domain-containing protein [Actibacterium sp. XHP0104]MCV2882085.1 Hpt domain-containing protein [Actibacterium sp. XHP0104]
MIDWDRVVELKTEVGDDAFDEVVDLFLEETDEEIAKLTTGGLADALPEILHFIKGSALNLGFQDLAALSARCEKALAGGGTVDCGEVTECYRLSKQCFLTRIGRLQPAA